MAGQFQTKSRGAFVNRFEKLPKWFIIHLHIKDNFTGRQVSKSLFIMK
jgi:hypothetical protein